MRALSIEERRADERTIQMKIAILINLARWALEHWACSQINFARGKEVVQYSLVAIQKETCLDR